MIATATNNGYFMWLEPYVFPDLENKNAVDTLNEYVPYQILYGQGMGYGSLLESRYTEESRLEDEDTTDKNVDKTTAKTSLGDISGAVQAGTGAIAVISEVFKGSDEKKRIRAACGNKPLVNKAKKEKYQQCVQALYAPQQGMRTTKESEGLSTGTIILIIVGSLLFIGGIITFVVLSKKK